MSKTVVSRTKKPTPKHKGRRSGLRCGGLVRCTPSFAAGDPAPTGYLDWHEWAHVQHKAGLRQETCPSCGKWWFPQELSDTKVTLVVHTSKYGIERIKTQKSPCLRCASNG